MARNLNTLPGSEFLVHGSFGLAEFGFDFLNVSIELEFMTNGTVTDLGELIFKINDWLFEFKGLNFHNIKTAKVPVSLAVNR